MAQRNKWFWCIAICVIAGIGTAIGLAMIPPRYGIY
jgi:hypothetical protein